MKEETQKNDIESLSKKRKLEIDNILKESLKKYENGEVKKQSLEEFETRLNKKNEEIKHAESQKFIESAAIFYRDAHDLYKADVDRRRKSR